MGKRLPSIFIIQDEVVKNQYELKFLETCKEDERNVINSILQSVRGIIMQNNILTIPKSMLSVFKSYLNLASIPYLFFDDEIYSERPKEMEVYVNKSSGVITTSKYIDEVVKLIKSINKNHRSYSKETLAWKITNEESLNTFIQRIKDLPYSYVELE